MVPERTEGSCQMPARRKARYDDAAGIDVKLRGVVAQKRDGER